MSSSTLPFIKYKLVQVGKTQTNEGETKVEAENDLEWLKDGLPEHLQKKGLSAYNAIKNDISVDDEGMVTYSV